MYIYYLYYIYIIYTYIYIYNIYICILQVDEKKCEERRLKEQLSSVLRQDSRVREAPANITASSTSTILNASNILNASALMRPRPKSAGPEHRVAPLSLRRNTPSPTSALARRSGRPSSVGRGEGRRGGGGGGEGDVLSAHVEVQLKLAMSFTAAGQQGSPARALFEESLVEDLARASGLSATNFCVKKVSPGSVIVDVEVLNPI